MHILSKTRVQLECKWFRFDWFLLIFYLPIEKHLILITLVLNLDLPVGSENLLFGNRFFLLFLDIGLFDRCAVFLIIGLGLHRICCFRNSVIIISLNRFKAINPIDQQYLNHQKKSPNLSFHFVYHLLHQVEFQTAISSI